MLEQPIYYYDNNPLSAMAQVNEGRMDAIKLMENLEPYIMKYVPGFGDEFVKYAVARHHWSILWQAAQKFSKYSDFMAFSAQFSMRENLKKLFDYPDRLIAISSRLFKIYPRMYYIIIRSYLKLRGKKS